MEYDSLFRSLAQSLGIPQETLARDLRSLEYASLPEKVRKEITGKVNYRTFTVVRESIDAENRTVKLAFSSENPVQRWWGNEILDHTGGACNLSRMQDGAPLLDNHDSDEQVGVVEAAEISDDRIGRCTVRFSRSTDGEEMFNDVKDGIKTKVSVGYTIDRDPEPEKGPDGKVIKDDDGLPTYRVMAWTPLEVSMVSIPADNSVGVGRGFEPAPTRKEPAMDPVVTAPTSDEIRVKAESDAKLAAIKRNTEIVAMSKRFEGRVGNLNELRDKALVEGWEVTRFNEEVLLLMEKNGTAIRTNDQDPTSAIKEKDLANYSIVRAIRQLAEGGRELDGLEREVSDEIAKNTRKTPKGFFIPEYRVAGGMQKRTLQADLGTQGAFLVQTSVLGSQFIELLRNRTKVVDLGATVLGGLTGNIAIPRAAGGATAYWLPETGTVTAADQAFGQLGLVPHRLVGDTAYTKELLIQSSVDVEGYVRMDLMKVLAIAKDLAALQGLGANGQPQGIANTTGIGSTTFSGAATWAKVIDFETQVAAANADVEKMAFLASPATRGKWKGIPKVSSYPIFLWENPQNGPGGGVVNGYRAEVSAQLTSGVGGSGINHQVIFGNWADLILADWAGIDVVVDPYSLKKAGQIEVTMTMWTDVGLRHPASFDCSSDAGNQ